MLEGPYERVMAVSRHFYMNTSTMQLLQSRCDPLFYFTSTAPIKQRLWSFVKYYQFNGHGTVSLGEEELNAAMEMLKTDEVHISAQIRILNAYPYLHDREHNVDMEGVDRIEPDYVIRKSNLVEDVSALLRAFGCSTDVVSRNVHESEFEKQLDSVEIDDDDSLHDRLTRYAEERNEEGVKKAFAFGR
ncbi:hypothetical protein FGB62_163g050 [Gracilaria domingensis]|nr:hypothetical protein FGB62_163g050 [Gracilaria domingensis]